MIVFDNWQIRRDGDCVVYQGDNLVRTLTVSGVPEGWDWELLVRVGEAVDVIRLAAVEENPDLMGIFHTSLGAMRSNTVVFTSGSWVSSDGGYTLTIPKADHGRQTSNFSLTLWHLVSSAYLRNTWAVLCTDVRYDGAAGSIVLDSAAPYDGKITFMG